MSVSMSVLCGVVRMHHLRLITNASKYLFRLARWSFVTIVAVGIARLLWGCRTASPLLLLPDLLLHALLLLLVLHKLEQIVPQVLDRIFRLQDR